MLRGCDGTLRRDGIGAHYWDYGMSKVWHGMVWHDIWDIWAFLEGLAGSGWVWWARGIFARMAFCLIIERV